MFVNCIRAYFSSANMTKSRPSFACICFYFVFITKLRLIFSPYGTYMSISYKYYQVVHAVMKFYTLVIEKNMGLLMDFLSNIFPAGYF